MIRIAVLVGSHGRGSNMQSLISACQDGRINGDIAVVIGANPDAPAIERAKDQNIKTGIVNPKDFSDMSEYGAVLLKLLQDSQTDIICLAGYMRLLPDEVVEYYKGKCLNIHPALLPAFGGKGMYGEHVHKAVIASGAKTSGCTVHFVDNEYDHGQILLQTVVPVLEDDSPETLAARILPEEHKTYVKAVNLLAERLGL